MQDIVDVDYSSMGVSQHSLKIMCKITHVAAVDGGILHQTHCEACWKISAIESDQ